MKRSILTIMLLTLCLARSEGETTAGGRAPSRESLVPPPAERDARLGMFVHWGVYSGLSGTWQGRKYGGYPEHIQRMAKIPIPVYLTDVACSFNPTGYNADEWLRLAKQAGMGYFVISAKHHAGTAMYDSKLCPNNIVPVRH